MNGACHRATNIVRNTQTLEGLNQWSQCLDDLWRIHRRPRRRHREFLPEQTEHRVQILRQQDMILISVLLNPRMHIDVEATVLGCLRR